MEENPTSQDAADDEAKPVANWFVMTAALMRKNVMILWSGKIRLFLLLVLPLLFFLIGVSLDALFKEPNEQEQYYSDYSGDNEEVSLKKCEWLNIYKYPTDECFTVMYATAESLSSADAEMVDRIMENLARDNNLVLETIENDELPTSYDKDIVGLANEELLASFLAQNDGHVGVTMYFTGNETDLTAHLIQNKTTNYNSFYDDDGITGALKKAALSAQLDNKPVQINIDIQEIGDQNSERYFDNYSEFSFTTVNAFLVIGYSFASIFFMNYIAREKQQELIGSLRVMGVHDSAYWMSWVFVSTLISLFSSLLIMIGAYICDYKRLSDPGFFLPLLLLWFSQTVITSSSLVLIPLASNQKVLNILQFVMVGTSITGFTLASIYNSYTVPPNATALHVFQYIFPSTNFALVLGPILDYSTKYAEYSNLPNNYNWKMLTTPLNDCEYVSNNDDDQDNKTCIWKGYTIQTEKCWGTEIPEDCYYSAPSHSSLLIMMIVQFFIYLVLIWYLFMIIPSSNGIAQRFWFIFDPTFWLKRKPSSETANADPNSLVTVDLMKQFNGGNIAVKDMNLEIPNGQIFALLGHNGAGKTTLINILTGNLPPTSGDAYLRGMQLSKDLRAIQEMTGVVPQHDRLWSELSAYEHILLFATLKGRGSASNIASILKKVHLESDQFQVSGEYSGGMKRRLSIAIASVGDAKIIFMDEPTTGIDPLNRRRIWKLIQDLKVGRIIVLTTHLMQEADVLGDTVGIMDAGVMKVKGTPLNLKTTYGSGYTLNICTSQSSDVDRICELARESIEGLEVVNTAATSISLGIPKDQVSTIPSFARSLQDEGLIQDWSVSQSTLEEVFLRLVSQENTDAASNSSPVISNNDADQEEQIEEDFNVIEENTSLRSDVNQVVFESKAISQVRALLKKQWILRKSSPIATFLQCLVPIGLVVIMKIAQELIKNDPTYVPQRCGGCNMMDCEQLCQKRSTPEFWQEIFASQSTNDNEFYEFYGSNIRDYLTQTSTWNSYEYEPYSCSTVDDHIGEVWTTATGVDFFDVENGVNTLTVKDQEDVQAILQYVDNQTNYFRNFPRTEDFTGYDYSILIGYGGSYYFGDLKNPTTTRGACYFDSPLRTAFDGIPSVGIDITKLPNKEETEIRFDLSLIYRPPLRRLYCVSDEDSCPEGSSISFVESKICPYCDFRKLSIDKSLYPLLSTFLNVHEMAIRPASLTKKQQDVSYYPAIPSSSMNMFSVLITISLSLSTISIIYEFITDKQNGHVFALLLNGLKIRNYWIASYIYHACFFIGTLILFLGFTAILGIKAINDMNWGNMIVVSLLFMHGQFSFICLFSNLLKKPRLASALLMMLIFILSFVMWQISTFDQLTIIPLALDVIPHISYIRSVYYLTTNYKEETILVSNLIMTLSSVVYLFFGIYLHGLRDISTLLKRLCSGMAHGCQKSALPQHNEKRDDNDDKELFNDTLDIDVHQEQIRAHQLMPSETAVKVEGLSKTFQMKGFNFKNAVIDLSLAMDKGEVFGLLGPNGAGKTTAISMITGQLLPSRGQIFVGGYDVVSERTKAMEKLGIVTQFDVLYDTLTVQQHLEMYSEIKGVAPNQIAAWSLHIAQKVSLHEPELYTRQANALSGGMRRRLSIGIALLSHPKVLFLDEPTTGLDPSIKRSIWEVIESMREDRCILLTTHSMDEAEALCNRIGIMAKGSLLCIGTQNHLRSRYGDSFELSFTTSQESVDSIRTLELFLENNFSHVTKVSSYGRSQVFTIPRGNIDLKTLFDIVIQGKSDGLYDEWGVGQSSLDEIFVTITAESEA